jgi:hypothetical protein
MARSRDWWPAGLCVWGCRFRYGPFVAIDSSNWCRCAPRRGGFVPSDRGGTGLRAKQAAEKRPCGAILIPRGGRRISRLFQDLAQALWIQLFAGSWRGFETASRHLSNQADTEIHRQPDQIGTPQVRFRVRSDRTIDPKFGPIRSDHRTPGIGDSSHRR